MVQPASKRIVTEGGAQSISGVKTFTVAPVVPQLAIGSLPATAAVVTSGTTRPTVPLVTFCTPALTGVFSAEVMATSRLLIVRTRGYCTKDPSRSRAKAWMATEA